MSYEQAVSALSEGRIDAGRELISGVLVKNPKSQPALEVAIQICLHQNDLSGVHDYAKRLLEINPHHLPSAIALGNSYLLMGSPENISLDSFDGNTNADWLFLLASAYRGMGQIEFSRENLSNVKKIEGETIRYRQLLLEINLEECKDPNLKLDLLNKEDIKKNDLDMKRFILFKKARILDEIGEFDLAFRAASDAHVDAQKVNVSIINNVTKTIINDLDRNLIQKLPKLSIGNRFLTLIISPPRAGSTLLERLLNAHSKVRGVGELADLTVLARRMRERSSVDFSYPSLLKHVNRQDMINMALSSSIRLKKLVNKETRLVSKDLMQVRHAALVIGFFKDSTVINLTRDPRDVAISCWLSGLDVHSHAWTNSLETISAYIESHYRLANHWDTLELNHLVKVKYEDLVQNTNLVLDKLCQSMGIKWEEEFLDKELRKNRLPTVEARLASQEVTERSIGRWERYQSYLSPILGQLAQIS